MKPTSQVQSERQKLFEEAPVAVDKHAEEPTAKKEKTPKSSPPIIPAKP